RAGRDTGLRPQLLVARDADQSADLIADGRYLMQPKHDGERRMLIVEVDGTVTGVNRSGLAVALPASIVEQAALLRGAAGRTVIDGEQIGDTFIAFDLIEDDGADLQARGANERFDQLAA